MARPRPMTVRLIDVGMDDDFTRYVDAIELTIQSFLTRTTYDDEPKKVELDTVRTRDIHIGVAALLAREGHGVARERARVNQEDSLGWFSDDDTTEWLLDDLNHLCDEQGRGIGAPILISDCCNGAR